MANNNDRDGCRYDSGVSSNSDRQALQWGQDTSGASQKRRYTRIRAHSCEFVANFLRGIL
jgi:hypothetical protein